MADGLKRLLDRQYLLWKLPWLVISLALAATALLGALLQSPAPDPFKPTGNSILTWLWYPIEQNPHLRLPFTSSSLQSITFTTDGNTGWAVGAGGMILKTQNGGKTWTSRPSGTTMSLHSVTSTNDGNMGWAVGAGGMILKTQNGGETWAPRPSGTAKGLWSVTFTNDGNMGWAVGDGGTILKTQNGGETWTQHLSSTSMPLQSVTFTKDGNTGWIVGVGGTILKTQNGGETWTQHLSSTSMPLQSVTFTKDGNTGWIVGVGGTILKTQNGGETWTSRPSGTAMPLQSVTFTKDGNTGWIVGAGGTILKTQDGGETWGSHTSGMKEDLLFVTFATDERTGWIVGAGGTILKTQDAGETWTRRLNSRSMSLHSVTLTNDGNMGWAVGGNGTVLKTQDGGKTWGSHTGGMKEDLLFVTFTKDGNTGWIVGAGGMILKTQDGGETWTSRPSGTAMSLQSVTSTNDGNMGWTVGDGGTILKTQNGGETWTQHLSSTSMPLQSVTFTKDGNTGWIVGVGGTILKTQDGGKTWTSRPSGTAMSLQSVTSTNDGNMGWAVGDGGTILKTQDGGKTWTSRPSGTAMSLQSVTSTNDGNTGWIVGDGGTILKTQDGGETWTSRPSGTAMPLQSVTFTNDGNIGLAVGWGVILLTDNGGKEWRLLDAAADYRKYPAPWTWIVFIFALLALLPTFQPLQSEPQIDGIADHFVSDRPIRAGDPDSLQRGLIANTLSRFLRNENTEPPMTIAITGNWGEGKSSLMNLMRADLEKHGTKTVWFNAWHHQKEQHLFAALLQAVRDQAIPSFLSLRGIPFRMRLVKSRARSHPIQAIFALVLLGLLVSALWMGPKYILNIFENLDGSEAPLGTSPLLGSSLLGIGIVYLIYEWNTFLGALKQWGINPGRLIAAASSTFGIKAFSKQLGFRHRFSEAFKEVAEALQPNTLLILIDDLDRCRPEQVVETLEAINFLVSAGPCYVVLGIAPDQVMHCVGLDFKEIAAETAEMPDTGNAPHNSEVWGREKRRDYARNYLEKLINIEVRIPKLTDNGAMELAALKSDEGRRETRKVLCHFAKVLAPWVVVLAILSAGFSIGSVLFQSPTPLTVSTPSGPQPNIPEPSPSPAPEPPPTEPVPPENEGDGTFRKGSNDGVPWWSSLLPAGLWVFVAIIAIVIYAWRRQEDRTKDSPRFTNALKIWHPLIRATTNTPRQMKRFMNRVRYLAMASKEPENATTSSGIRSQKEHLSESLIVALAALQGLIRDIAPENNEKSLLQALENLLTKTPGELDGDIDRSLDKMFEELEKEEKLKKERIQEIRDIKDKLIEAFANHRKTFQNEKVAEDHLEQFYEMASGIMVH